MANWARTLNKNYQTGKLEPKQAGWLRVRLLNLNIPIVRGPLNIKMSQSSQVSPPRNLSVQTTESQWALLFSLYKALAAISSQDAKIAVEILVLAGGCEV